MSLEDDVRDLARNTTLRDLDIDALRLIAFSAEARLLAENDVLFREGDPSDGGFFLRSGAIRLEAGGRSSIVRPPAMLGDSALLTETMRPATAVASEPSSVLKISRAVFHRVLTEYPDSAVRLRRSMAGRLQTLAKTLDKARADVFEG